MIAEILCLAAVIVIPFWKLPEKSAEPEQLPEAEYIEEDEEPDFEVIEEKVDNLVQIRKQLESAEDGVNSVMQCCTERQSEFQLKYTSAKTGKSTIYRFWADGENEETDMLLQLMESERNQLRSVLLERITELQE